MSTVAHAGSSLVLPIKVENIYLLNNPKTSLKHTLPYRTFDWPSDPAVVVRFNSEIADDQSVLKIHLTNGESYKQEFQIKKGFNEVNIPIAFKKDIEIGNALDLQISSKTISIPLPKPVPNFKLRGVVTDLSGEPIQGAWVVVLDSSFFQIATTDERGAYSLSLPTGHYDSIAAFDSRYPTSRVEDYFWNLTLKADRELDFKISNVEVFRLTATAMRQDKVIVGTFITWSSSLLKACLEKHKPKDMSAFNKLTSVGSKENGMPDLNTSSISILLNGCPLTKFHLDEQRSSRFAPAGKGNYEVFPNYVYKFEASYRGVDCPIHADLNELEVRIKTPEGETGRGRFGALNFL